MESSPRIKLVRLRLGWKQPEMGRFLGVSQAAVSHMEAGQAESGPISRLLEMLSAAIERGQVEAGSAPADCLRAIGGEDAGGESRDGAPQ
jgi:transcriptional regulator with XRE-family HTH domain